MSSPDSPPIIFDQFQRYNFIRQVIDHLSSDTHFKVLEVGSASSPLRSLLNGHFLVSLDEAPLAEATNVRASGIHLPFADNAFDIVVCTDVLEHMYPDARPTFLSQLCRVSAQTLILGFPQNIPESKFVDRSLFEFNRILTGEQHQYLKEHLQYGLPDPAEIRNLIQPFLSQIFEYDNSSTSSWLLLQAANFLTSNHSEFKDSARNLSQLFNKHLNVFSHTPPCYRKFFVGFKKPIQASILNDLKQLPEPDLTAAPDQYAITSQALAESFVAELKRFKKEKEAQLASAMQTIREQKESIQNQEESIRKHQESIRSHKNRILQQEAEVLTLKEKIQWHSLRSRNLEDYLNLFLNHPAYKAYKLVKSILGKIYPPLRNSIRNINYQLFQNSFEPQKEELFQQTQACKTWESKPRLNLITAVCDPPFKIFREAVESILNQTYEDWIWNLADASKTDRIWNYLQELSNRNPKVQPVRLTENYGIAENINVALRSATGTYVVLFDHDDVLAPNALFEVANAIRKDPDVDFLYSDADILDGLGNRCFPFFKPDWSPEAMLSYNLLNQLSVFRRSWLDSIGYLDPQMDGAQDWDLYLRITEKTERIQHIPKILYHWRQTPQSTAQSIRNKPYAQTAQLTAVTNHLKRIGLRDPDVFFVQDHPVYGRHPLCRWKLSRDWKVSIVIPNRDQPELLSECLGSLFERTSYQNYEVILVDTGTTNQKTLEIYKYYEKNPRFKRIEYKGLFNFGRACNQGASKSTGDLLLFLNNDTEVIQADWLELMIQWFERDGVGIVGPKLLYPNLKIQHAGVIVGFGGLAGHLFQHENEHATGLMGPESWYRNLSSVTAACMLIRKEAFEVVEGFDEGFQLNYSDVDLCLKTREAGYRIVYTPQVRLIHHESATHKGVVPRADFERATQKWQNVLQNGDPYFNPNLTYTKSRPDFKQRDNDSPSELNRHLMFRLPEKEFIQLPEDIQ